MRGVVRYEHDDLDHAVADLDQALEIDPKYVPAFIERAYLRQWRNQLDEAIVDVSKAIELDPRNSYAYVERGVFAYSKKEYDKAMDDFQKAIDLGSQAAVIYIARGMILLNKRDPNKAFAELKRAQELDPRHPDVYAGMAKLFMMQGKNDRALKVLDQAVAIDPQCADSHGNRAVVYLAMGKYDKAVDDLDEVLRVAPSSARAAERAWILATCPNTKIREGSQAVLSANKACELTGWNEPLSLAILAAACSEAADFEGAVKWQQKAVELLPRQEPRQTRVSRITRAIQRQEAVSSSGIARRNGHCHSPRKREVMRPSVPPTNVHAERNPFMPPILSRSTVALAIVVGICTSADASDLPGGASLQPFVRPKKSSSTQDRAFEYMQKSADFSLNDGRVNTVPSGVGFICLLEALAGRPGAGSHPQPGPTRMGTRELTGSAQPRRSLFLTTNPGQSARPVPVLDAGNGPLRKRRPRSCLCRRRLRAPPATDVCARPSRASLSLAMSEST